MKNGGKPVRKGFHVKNRYRHSLRRALIYRSPITLNEGDKKGGMSPVDNSGAPERPEPPKPIKVKENK